MTENRTRTEGRVLLAPHEEEKLLGLLRRSDALGMAYDAVFDSEDWGSDEHKAQTLWILGEISAEAHEAGAAYRAEVGIPDPVSKNARKPA